MKKGVLYQYMDCLNVLETLENNTFSLIYLDIPEDIAIRSERINFGESGSVPMAVVTKEGKKHYRNLDSNEIKLYLEECENNRQREYERYLFKIAQNCFRVLKDEGIVIFREQGGESQYVDMRYILSKFFRRCGIRVMESASDFKYKNGFDLIHVYSNREDIYIPEFKVSEEKGEFPFWDERGYYRLRSLECAERDNNWFCWGSHTPAVGRGWKYSIEELEKLRMNGEIAFVNIEPRGMFPYLKYYRDENQVFASSIWNDKNTMERIFNLYTRSGDRVLGIYESLWFATMAEQSDLEWCSVSAKDWYKKRFPGQGRIEKDCIIIDSLKEHKEREYSINIPLLTEYKEKKDFMYEIDLKEGGQEVDEEENSRITTDEILTYHIENFLSKNKISENTFFKISGVTRTTVQEMKQNRLLFSKLSKAEKKVKSVSRTMKTIIRVAVYTGMPLDETRRALKDSRHEFDLDNPVDVAIVEWLREESQDIYFLNEMIRERCIDAGMPEEEVENVLFTPIYG